MTAWRLLDSPPAPGAHNMAVDRALLESVRDGAPPVLRFYRWDPPCLSFGRNQPARGRHDADALAGRGIHVVRRPTGGAAVHHDRELTYAVVVPVGALGSPRESYVRINDALVAGLRRLGAEAGVAGDGQERHLDGPCFDAVAPGEVVADGRKLVGSAVRVRRRTLLQHGSLLLDGDQALAAEPACAEPGARPLAPATLGELLGSVPRWPRLVAALRAGFERVLGIRLAREDLSNAERARIEALTAHFRSADWTWRR